jgi:hypothetical protein
MTRLRLIGALILSGIGVAALATPAASMRGAGIHMGAMGAGRPMMGAPHVRAMGVGRPMMGAPHVRMYSAPIGRSRAYAWQGQRHANFRRFHGRRVFFAGGYPYYDYDYGDYGYSGCGYLYRRAVATGSSYWWHRYRACRY